MSPPRGETGPGGGPGGGRPDGGEGHAFRLASEFAQVRVRLDTAANGPRVEVTDLSSGRRILLDPLELATLSWCSHGDLAALVDPARWWAEEDIPLGPPEH